MTLAIVISFLLFIGYREWQHQSHIRDLELKALSKTPQEYAQLKHIDKPIKREKPVVEDELVDPLEISANDALKGLNRE